MERAAMLVGKTMKRLKGVSIGARGLYLTCDLLACLKTDDDIESGVVEFWGEEATPAILAAHLKEPTKIIEGYLAELKKAVLVTLDPLTLILFAEDNAPFLAIRRSNRDRKGMKYKRSSPEFQAKAKRNSGRERIGKDRIGKERKGEKMVSAADVKTFTQADLGPDFQDEFAALFRQVFSKETCVPFTIGEGEYYAEKYGKDKLFAMMKSKAGGYWDWVKKDLDNPRNKPSKREAEEVRTYYLDCMKCGVERGLQTVTNTTYRCVCGHEVILPGSLDGLTSEDLSDDVVKVLAAIEKIKKA